MSEDLFEGLIIGGTIGLAVIAIRVLFVGHASAGQALALALAGVILCAAQIVLALRRVRRDARPAEERPEPLWLASRRRLSRKNPFAQELTHNWTGLDDRLPDATSEPKAEDESYR
jgi:hypothetical protein